MMHRDVPFWLNPFRIALIVVLFYQEAITNRLYPAGERSKHKKEKVIVLSLMARYRAVSATNYRQALSQRGSCR
jgi:hypothetical protein